MVISSKSLRGHGTEESIIVSLRQDEVSLSSDTLPLNNALREDRGVIVVIVVGSWLSV